MPKFLPPPHAKAATYPRTYTYMGACYSLAHRSHCAVPEAPGVAAGCIERERDREIFRCMPSRRASASSRDRSSFSTCIVAIDASISASCHAELSACALASASSRFSCGRRYDQDKD